MRPTSLSGSILQGMCRKIVKLYDVEVRFDCTGSHKMRPVRVAGSILHCSHRKTVMLSDAEVRFDCAGS